MVHVTLISQTNFKEGPTFEPINVNVWSYWMIMVLTTLENALRMKNSLDELAQPPKDHSDANNARNSL